MGKLQSRSAHMLHGTSQATNLPAQIGTGNDLRHRPQKSQIHVCLSDIEKPATPGVTSSAFSLSQHAACGNPLHSSNERDE